MDEASPLEKWKSWIIDAQAFKSFARSCNVETLNYFNPELQLRDTESKYWMK